MLEALCKLEGLYEDGVICESETQSLNLWKLREGISMATAHYGMVMVTF